MHTILVDMDLAGILYFPWEHNNVHCYVTIYLLITNKYPLLSNLLKTVPDYMYFAGHQLHDLYDKVIPKRV